MHTDEAVTATLPPCPNHAHSGLLDVPHNSPAVLCLGLCQSCLQRLGHVEQVGRVGLEQVPLGGVWRTEIIQPFDTYVRLANSCHMTVT